LNDPIANTAETGMETAANWHIDCQNDANVSSKLHHRQKPAYYTGVEHVLHKTAVNELIFKEN